MRRRKFIHRLAQLGAITMPAFPARLDRAQDQITFGLLADPHADLVPDHMDRLEAFMRQVDQRKPDFIFQLGDFCFPKVANQSFLNLWNQFEGPKYHTLGNHDMDISSKEVVMDFWGMAGRYYSFDIKNLHVVVLDANNIRTKEGDYVPYDTANFYIDDSMRTFIDPPQLEWLVQDLSTVQTPILIFSHQSLTSPCWGVKNRMAVQRILEDKNQDASTGQVIACFNGHDHIDYHRIINNIHYLEINSMAYQWLGQDYSDKSRYPADLYEAYPSLDKFAPYQDSLFTFVTVDIKQQNISIMGKDSAWLAPSPEELGMLRGVEGCQSTPSISERKLSF